MPHYESIRAMVTEGGAGGKKRGESFQKVFDSLLAIQENRDHWDSLMRERPGLADTLARLLQLDSAFRAK